MILHPDQDHAKQADLIARLSAPEPVMLDAEDLAVLWRVLDRVTRVPGDLGRCSVCGFTLACSPHCATRGARAALRRAAFRLKSARMPVSTRN